MGLFVLAQSDDDINQSPYAKYGFMALMFAVGIFLVFNGIRGVRKKETTVTSRFKTKEYKGGEAVFAGWAQIGIGALFLVVSVLVMIFR